MRRFPLFVLLLVVVMLSRNCTNIYAQENPEIIKGIIQYIDGDRNFYVVNGLRITIPADFEDRFNIEVGMSAIISVVIIGDILEAATIDFIESEEEIVFEEEEIEPE
jgi:hypothetical protein